VECGEKVTLALLQRQLLQLVKCESAESFDDPYLNKVASCEGLEAIREISRSWNAFSLERLCPLTYRLLQQRGELETALIELEAAPLQSAFVEDLGLVFLDQQVRAGAPVVADVARFETAVLAVYLGLSTSEMVEWRHHPDVVIGDLVTGRIVGDVPLGTYRTVVSLDLPSLYRLCD
jgi:hypothetical protein